ncbi:serine hydrolase domain-containing protein [Leucobacter celer]|uniref:serine hydrolase domain-containing protein n=1 Tax=Leucobacter celer TaxID=668625 RepID=UPI0006A7CE12|nr:serine hydrolase domain-containing protein [Leucobacter celer]
MSVDAAIRKSLERIQRPVGRGFPVPPIALVTGPRLELVAGDPDQPFWIASIDKVFIATLIAQLFDDGHCHPDTPLGELLPADEVAPLPAAAGIDNARDVTVQHLLSHTSGLPDVMLPPRGFTTECSIDAVGANPARVWTVPEFLRQADHLPPFARPGERFLYSDTAYLLLIRIIEEARGGGFGEQLRDRILDPCGMADSAAWVDAGAEEIDDLVPRLAPFWLGDPGRDDRRAFAPSLTWGSGMGGPSTANDLVRFQRELHGGRLCDPAWIRLFGAPRSRFRPGIHYGTGMVALRFGGFFPLLRGYPEPVGGLGYTATHMFYYPEQQTHVVLNYHAHRRMQASFQTHIRLAGIINRYG